MRGPRNRSADSSYYIVGTVRNPQAVASKNPAKGGAASWPHSITVSVLDENSPSAEVKVPCPRAVRTVLGGGDRPA